MTAYVVRRPFRNYGEVLTAGTVISDPAVIKHFKSRVKEGKILVVAEHQYEAIEKYFLAKFGVEVSLQPKPIEKVVVKDVPQVKEESAKVTAKPEVKVRAVKSKATPVK